MISSSSLLLLLLGASLSSAQLKVYSLRATDLPSNLVSTTDGYVKVYVGSKSIGQTTVRNDDTDPWWGEEFAYLDAKENDELKLEVYDRDLMFDDLLGTCKRQIRVGTYQHDCFLSKGGTLHYSYTLG
ncbi:uncharacterized protein LOC129411242 [Boleophthalmus pectinirostris]|uniref:uncharacterized protein LOC129411242 n=1 Tax=Boleophthalmus pectinirostris TaxID=150288 RepID=UPI00242AE506|nr:uncharacterized protein LOC129411242 [Boleophthalmus pectinirostris]XP_055017446.1 uncharacterized protein LOC129411242 [Boleophthalmus pectinirostris]